MKKREKVRRHVYTTNQPIPWLPIDSRIIPFFSFSRVHGLARVFLIIEMTLSVSVVIATLVLVVVTKIY